MLICSFHKKISSVNSELSKEINLEIVFHNLERFILQNFTEEISLMERSDWSVAMFTFVKKEALTALSMLAFESLFSM